MLKPPGKVVAVSLWWRVISQLEYCLGTGLMNGGFEARRSSFFLGLAFLRLRAFVKFLEFD